jgi:hypothetical protein
VKLTFYDSKADILLLEMTSTIPDKFKPYKLGYDGSVDAVPTAAVGIHHPNGNIKRISYANERWSCSSLLLHDVLCCSQAHQATISKGGREIRVSEVMRARHSCCLQREHFDKLHSKEVPQGRDPAVKRHALQGVHRLAPSSAAQHLQSWLMTSFR